MPISTPTCCSARTRMSTPRPSPQIGPTLARSPAQPPGSRRGDPGTTPAGVSAKSLSERLVEVSRRSDRLKARAGRAPSGRSALGWQTARHEARRPCGPRSESGRRRSRFTVGLPPAGCRSTASDSTASPGPWRRTGRRCRARSWTLDDLEMDAEVIEHPGRMERLAGDVALGELAPEPGVLGRAWCLPCGRGGHLPSKGRTGAGVGPRGTRRRGPDDGARSLEAAVR